MNTKTAKHLKKLALYESQAKGYPLKWAYKQIKELWKKTPQTNKARVFE